MTAPTNVVVHCAGEMIEWVQVCVDCGTVLADYRNAAWPEGDRAPQGWQEGGLIRKDGSCSSLVRRATPDRRCTETLQ